MAFAAAAAAAAVLAFLQHKRAHSKLPEPAADSKQEGEPQELAPKLSTPSGSASQWLASIRSSTSYGELEMLADGDVVYLRCVDRLEDNGVVTARLPRARRLEVHPLHGKPDSVPTSALDPLSVWVVRRRQQELSFTLLSTRNSGRHTLEADPQSPHGVSLGGGGVNRRGRWLITPTGLANLRWPQHMLPYHVLPVHLLDARTVGAVKAAFGKQLQAAAQKMDEEQRARAAAEEHCALLEGSLKQTKDMHTTAMSQLRAQLDSALRARHAAEREAQAAQGQRAEESIRAKAAQTQAAQAAHDAAQQAALVRQLQQQVQGMLAGHAEELRTLHSELQIARETNEVLKRAMGEQVLQLQGELELRDARIVELEEANEKMDAVLQVIQAQLGGDPMQHHHDLHGMGLDPAAEELPAPDLGEGGTPLAAAAAGGDEEQQQAQQEGVGGVEVLDDERNRAGAATGSCAAAGAGAGAQERPLWASVLELHGDLSLTALQESLVISRRSTILGAPGAAPVSDAEADGTLAPGPVHHLDLSLGDMPAGNLANGSCFASANAMSGLGPQAWPCRMSLDRSSSVGSTDGDILASHPLQGQLTFVENAGEWGSGGGSDEAMCAAVQRLLVAQAAGQEDGSPTGSGCSGSGPGRKEGVGGVPEAGVAAGEVPGPARGRANGSCPGGDPGPNPFAVPGLNIPGMGLGSGMGLGGAAGAASFFGAQPKTALGSGVEAVLTLDCLRRRMRELDAERERLSLLSRSLQGALPWRDSATPPQPQAQPFPPPPPQLTPQQFQQQLAQQKQLQASEVLHPLEQVLGSQASSSRSSMDTLAPMEVQAGVAVEAEEAVEAARQVEACESASAQGSATAGHGAAAAAAASSGPSPEEQHGQQPAAESGLVLRESAPAADAAPKAVVAGVAAAVASRELAAAGGRTASPLTPARLASTNAGSNVRRLAAQLFGAQVDSPTKQWSPKAQQQQQQHKLLLDAPAMGDRGAQVEEQAAAASPAPEGVEPTEVRSPAFTKYGSASAVLERGSPSSAGGPAADAIADAAPLGLAVGQKQLVSALSAAPASCSPSMAGAMHAETERCDFEDDTNSQAPAAKATDPSPEAPGNKGRSAAGSRRPDINVRTSSLGLSVHDSICNLASTRALPTARPMVADAEALGVAAATAVAAAGGGGGGGAALGRYMGSQTPSHSRTPSGLPPCLSEEDHLLGAMDAEDAVDDGDVDDSVVKDIDQTPLPPMLLGGAALGAAGKGLPISSAHRAYD